MNRAAKILIILMIASVCAINIDAQNQSVRFNHIDVENGLSQNMVRLIGQDSRGFMWIATWDGLNRYDGYEFKVYKHIDGDSTSLRVNKISCLLEDHKKRLWVGTYGGGLSLFNRDDETFTNFIHDPKDDNSTPSDKILNIFEDSKHRLWVGTQLSGVSLVEFENNSKSNSKKIKFINLKNNPNDKSSISSTGTFMFC